MNFRQYTETVLTPKDINHWASYAAWMNFSSPEEAREWLFQKKEKADREFGHVFGVDGPEKNREFANSMPIYQSGKSWKIGKRIRVDHRLRLTDLKVRKPDAEYIYNTTTSCTDKEFEYAGIKWLRIADLIGTESDMYSSQPKEEEYIRSLADKIKNNGWIEAVIVGQSAEGLELWEGQHRVRAMRVLGFKTVPAFVVKLSDHTS